MKINELNMFQNLLGRNPFGGSAADTAGVAGAISRAKKSGLSREDQLTQDIFVKKFVTRGLNSIKTAVEQGIVDINAVGGAAQPPNPDAGGAPQPGATAQPGGPSAAPGAAGQPGGKAGAAQPAPGTAAAAAASAKKGQSPGNQAVATGQKQGVAKPEIDQNVDKIVSAMRQLQPAGTKPLPPESKMAKEIAADLSKVSLNKDYLLRVGERILKANNAGYDVKDLHRQFMGQHAKGVKMKSIQEERIFALLVKLITEEKFRQQVRESGHHPSIVITKFKTLLENSTNEGIVDKVKGFFGKKPAAAPQGPDNLQVPPGTNPAAAAAPAQPAAGAQAAPAAAPAGSGKPDLGKWFKDTFMGNFLRGIKLDTAMPQIQKILDNMGKSYKSGGIKQDLTNIAMIAFAQSDMGKTQDKKAPV